MSFYGGLASTASRLIASKGRTVTLRRNTEGTYNPITGNFTGTSTTDVSVSAVFTEFKQQEIDGTLILRGDKKVLFASDAEPEHNDIIVDGSTHYKVIEIMEVQPGDTLVLYKVQVRK